MAHFDRSADLIFQLKGTERCSAAEALARKTQQGNERTWNSRNIYLIQKDLCEPSHLRWVSKKLFLPKLEETMRMLFKFYKMFTEVFSNCAGTKCKLTLDLGGISHQVTSSLQPFLAFHGHVAGTVLHKPGI